MYYRLLAISILVLVLLSLLVLSAVLRPQALMVSVLPAGKGDAVLVESPSGKTVLVNTGSDASILRALGTALPEWRRSFAALVLTSPASAEAGGAPDVLARYRTTELLRPEAMGSRTLEEALKQAGTRRKIVYPHEGDRYALGGGATLDVLWPPETPSVMNTENGALLVRISYGSTSFLVAEGVSARITAWVTNGSAPASVIIGTSTPAATYVSDGRSVHTK